MTEHNSRVAEARAARESARLPYAVAALSVLLAVALTRLPVVGPKLLGSLFCAIFVSAWYGGLWPGLAATGLIVVVGAGMLVLGTVGSFPFLELVSVAMFVLLGVLISLLLEALHAARRRAETNRRWLEAVLTSIGDAVIATDAQGRITFVNGVAEDLTGWPRGEAVGAPLDAVAVVRDEPTRQTATNPAWRAIETGRIEAPSDGLLLVSRDGATRPVSEGAAPIREAGGKVGGAVMVFRDITERRRDEQERERLNHELRENDRRKDEFLAMLAHELRNPLAAIGQAVALATQTNLREHVDWSLEVANRQVRHLTRMIDDLLDVSRITRGKIVLRRETLEATALLEHAVSVVRPLIEERGHRLDLALDRGNLCVHVDPTRLEQVVVNLLTNAAKYSGNGSRIWLEARRADGHVVIAVRDNGQGIAPERIHAMFEMFTQGDRSLARSEGGLGIGLTVVKDLVEMHGGSVEATSEGLGLGSQFTVRLPAAVPKTGPSPGVEPTSHAADSTPARVLVVDDNKDTAMSLATLLTFAGHDVETAHTGPDALVLARSQRPDLVLLDIGLPGMDGLEVAARLREDGSCPDAKLVAITGYGQESDVRRSREAGFDEHLVKPVQPERLLTLVASLRTSGKGKTPSLLQPFADR